MSRQELEAEKAHPDEAYIAESHILGPAKVNFWRGTTFNTLVVGFASFLAPGAYSALASTGAGGLADVNIGNASVALAYALIVPSALAATGTIAKIGPRYTLAAGASGYVFYAAALYQNSATGNQWFLILGAIICGATSGLFWVTEGMIIMIYSEPDRKGRLMSLWQSIYQIATCIGGAINLGLNIDLDKPGGLKPKTYLVFVALNAIAPLAALMLSNPKQVQRKDREPVPDFPSEGFWREVWLTIKELNDPRIVACCFLWSQALFIPSWYGTYLAVHFSVRVRGLSSLIAPILTIILINFCGQVLDTKRLVLRKKLIITWGVLQLVSLLAACWLVGITVQQSKEAVSPVFDWTTPGFAKAWVPYLLGVASCWTLYGYNYYMASYAFPSEATGIRTSRIIATLRSAESGSAAIAFGINSIGYPLEKIGYINLVFVIVCIFAGGYVLRYIAKKDLAGGYDQPAAVAAVPVLEPTQGGA